MKQIETEMIEALRRGEKTAMRQFYLETHRKLLSWVRSRVAEPKDAEEITQDCYLAFLDSLPLYREKCSLKTFLVAIAKHEINDYWRKRYAKKAILTIPFVDQVYTEKLYSSSQMAMVIRATYRKLLPSETQILKWKYEDELDLNEIAQRLHVSLKAAESRLFRARKAFQAAYLLVNH